MLVFRKTFRTIQMNDPEIGKLLGKLLNDCFLRKCVEGLGEKSLKHKGLPLTQAQETVEILKKNIF